jgi:hypothetical protein
MFYLNSRQQRITRWQGTPMTRTSTAAAFTPVEFAELRCTIGDLHGAWFPQYDGVHLADLPPLARLAHEAHRLISLVAARDTALPAEISCQLA